MDNRFVKEFSMLLRRELWESKNLFISPPAVLMVLLVVALIFLLTQAPGEWRGEGIGELSNLLQRSDVPATAIQLMPAAAPFIVVFLFCSLIYLINALYQDRKDSSILFWQSMPVSNLNTVISKILTVCFVGPIFLALAYFALIVAAALILAIYGIGTSGLMSGLGTFFLAGVYSLILVYLNGVLAILWFFPLVGWLLLFSAYARSLPFLWATGAFILLILVEGIVFDSQFLGIWVNARMNLFNIVSYLNFIVLTVGDFFDRLFSYDMLFGLVMGGGLVVSAVYMRRLSE